jgi:hypothetical protein
VHSSIEPDAATNGTSFDFNTSMFTDHEINVFANGAFHGSISSLFLIGGIPASRHSVDCVVRELAPFKPRDTDGVHRPTEHCRRIQACPL